MQATLIWFGSRIVAEVIGGALKDDEHSYWYDGWEPRGGTYRAQDFFTDAGVAPERTE